MVSAKCRKKAPLLHARECLRRGKTGSFCAWHVAGKEVTTVTNPRKRSLRAALKIQYSTLSNRCRDERDGVLEGQEKNLYAERGKEKNL